MAGSNYGRKDESKNCANCQNFFFHKPSTWSRNQPITERLIAELSGGPWLGSVLQEVAQQFRDNRRLFERRHVRRVVNQFDARIEDELFELLGVDRLGQPALLAPDERHRRNAQFHQ
ncbi:MAG: hypothetical protein IVW56_05040 [Candidatus Binataceae bacterium]|nr:hypothetical protein [Candidatus Binataceae bacterium]